MISTFYALLVIVLFYHIVKKLTDQGIPEYLMNVIRRRCEQEGDGEGEEIEMRGRQDSGCASVGPPPTVTVVQSNYLYLYYACVAIAITLNLYCESPIYLSIKL